MQKCIHCLITGAMLFANISGARPAPPSGPEGSVSFSGAWALYPLVVKWAEEYRKLYPETRIDIGAGGAGKGMADCLAGIVDIGMVSRDIYPAEKQQGAWWVSVARDAVVPTVSASNPFLPSLLEKGITRESFIRIWITGEITLWSELAEGSPRAAIHVYTRSDACGAAEMWAKYLGGNQEDLLDIGVYGDPGLAEAVRKDALGIGYNNINYAYDARTRMPVKGIWIPPIDLNGNGRVDPDEDFYGTRDQIVQAIGAGRYPSPPARDLYFVSRGKPPREPVIRFIRWVLTRGQEYVPEAGYIPLPADKLKEGLRLLEE
ncbi:MAG TPA: PstS family phosphate ABC transporter substrate-binding protein [bacterium]|nr:PstS family phosphate ABC transporter substrate-binding protein [bacterium]